VSHPGPTWAAEQPGALNGDRFVARHRTRALGKEISFLLSAPAALPRRRISEALGAAVAELRAVDAAFSPVHRRSLVSAVRRGELSHEAYPPPLAEVVARCGDMRAATDGWFDAWAVPGGFDPHALVKGWAVDRAGMLLRAAGIEGFAIRAGADRLVHGTAPHGGPWRIGLADPADPLRRTAAVELTEGALAVAGGRTDIVNPHSGTPAQPGGLAAVSGPQLAIANAYAVALSAAGPAGLDWFPTLDGYQAILLDGRPTPPPRRPRVLPPGTALPRPREPAVA
jgi:thiamine biosynthesis lipoprotein